MIYERYRRNPWQRPSPAAPAPPTADADKPPEPSEFDEEAEPDAWDEADELAAMSDADFYRQLRADVEGVRAGTVPSIAAAQRPSPKDRLRSRRYKRRDRYGKAF